MRPSYASWVAAIGRHYRAVIGAAALLAVLAALSLTRLQLDINVLDMLPRGTPAFDDFKAFLAGFGELDELLILVDGAPPATLQRFVDALAPRLAGLDTVAGVDARIDTDRVLDGMLGTYLFNYIPLDAYAQVAERLSPAGIDAAVAADRAVLSAPFDLSAGRVIAGDPLGLRRIAGQHLADAYAGMAPRLDGGYFAARDGSALLVFAHPKASAFDTDFSRRLMDQVRAAVADTQRELGGEAVRVRYTGSYVFALEDAGTIESDIARYTCLALLGVLAIFYLGYGNLRILPFVTFPLAVTTLLTFALSLLLYDQLNALSISFAAILYGLSIDSGIYFYSRLVDERRRTGGDIHAAVTATLAGLGRANVAASATTAGAFAVIGLSVLGAVRQLGVLTAIGMVLTTVEFFTLYPALGFALGGGRRGELRTLEAPRLESWAAAARQRGRRIRVGLVLAAIVCGIGASRVQLDASLAKLRPADSDAMRVQDEIADRFTHDGGGAVVVRRPTVEQALVDAERVADVLRDARARGLVGSVQSVDAVLPSAQTQRARLARADQLPWAAAVEHLRASLMQQGFKPEPFAPALAALAAPHQAVVRLGDPALQPLAFVVGHHVRIGRAGSAQVAVYLDPAAGVAWPAVAARLRAELGDMPIAIAARPLLEDELGRVLRHELALFLVLALVDNLLLLLAIVRDVRTSVAVLAPVALVVVALMAGMWATGVSIDPVNLMIPPLLVGIGVDNGVYLAAAARQRGSVALAARGTGRAIVVTALTTIAGFGFLAFSIYPPLATLGRLMAIGLSLCLAGTLFVLPALLPDAAPRRGATG